MSCLRRKSAFSLVEVLVAIAILVLLTAIFLPVFAQGKRAGERSVCLSNLMQLGKGVALYSVDHDGKNPRVPSPVSRHVAEGPQGARTPFLRLVREFEADLSQALISYGVAARQWRCPSDQASPMYGLRSGTWHAEIGSSYDYDDVTAFGLAPEPSDPSQAVLMMDIEAWHGGLLPSGTPFIRPQGRRNLLFYDLRAAMDPERRWSTAFAPVSKGR